MHGILTFGLKQFHETLNFMKIVITQFVIFFNRQTSTPYNNTDIHCESEKLGHFYFYYNFGKCGQISIILSFLDS